MSIVDVALRFSHGLWAMLWLVNCSVLIRGGIPFVNAECVGFWSESVTGLPDIRYCIPLSHI
jgi:hypothetical protein